MPEQFGNHDTDQRYPSAGNHPPGRGMPWWGWLTIAVVTLAVLPCFGCVGWFAYISIVGPDTAVYTGNSVPARFTDTVQDVGALEPNETLLYFYSDALTDIRNGFYFVSDKRIVIYSNHANGGPLTVVEFDQIKDLSLARDTSFFNDSQIYLELKDGTPTSFPVSSENDGDERFFEAIRQRVEPAGDD